MKRQERIIRRIRSTDQREGQEGRIIEKKGTKFKRIIEESEVRWKKKR